MTKRVTTIDTADPTWKRLYALGGWAALAAGVLFRRNLGVEVGLFAPAQPPADMHGWFALLNANPILGLTYLNLFDVVNALLLAVVFAALAALLRKSSPSASLAALVLGLLGAGVLAASNTALSMLALARAYGAAPEAGRGALEAAGQALMALNRFGASGAHPGSGGYASLLLIAGASWVFAAAMLRSRMFPRAAAYIGIAASALDLAYCAAYAFIPGIDPARLAVIFIPAAGLLWMVWHVWVGARLARFGREGRRVVKAAAGRQPG